MRNIAIDCEGMRSLSVYPNGGLCIDLGQVDLSFLEQMPADEIARYTDIKEILGAIDYDTIIDYLEERYDIEPIRIKR